MATVDWQAYRPTKKVSEVLRFLESAGFEVKSSTMYRHCKDGRLRCDKAGVYTLAALRQYVNGELLPSPVDDDEEDEEAVSLRVQKTTEEIGRLRAERRLKELKYEVEQGKYILADDAYAEMAARAVVLDSGLSFMIHSQAAKFVALVKGHQELVPELIAEMTKAKDALLAEYAKAEFSIEEG